MACVRAFALLLTVSVLSACGEDTVEPRVLPAVTISVVPARLTLGVGATVKLEATVRDAEGDPLPDRTITWTSSAPEVAEVSGDGVVRALGAGTASISAFSEPGIGFARIVVQEDFRLPLPGGRRWLLRTEIGTPGPGCAGDEGGLRDTGGRDCSHAGVSRYSLDFGAETEEDGPLPAGAVEVLAAADGRVIDRCLLPQAVNCGPDGPFVIVEHRGGFRTLYAHLDPDSVTVLRKTELRRGDRIGTMRASGTGPWMHFELRYENRGAGAAEVLEELLVDGRKLADYRVSAGNPTFYPSSNAGDAGGSTPRVP